GRPTAPALRTDVPDVDDLRPASAARGTDVERTLQTEHLGHTQDGVLPKVLHVGVLALTEDVDGFEQVQVPVGHQVDPFDSSRARDRSCLRGRVWPRKAANCRTALP